MKAEIIRVSKAKRRRAYIECFATMTSGAQVEWRWYDRTVRGHRRRRAFWNKIRGSRFDQYPRDYIYVPHDQIPEEVKDQVCALDLSLADEADRKKARKHEVHSHDSGAGC